MNMGSVEMKVSTRGDHDGTVVRVDYDTLIGPVWSFEEAVNLAAALMKNSVLKGNGGA